jgi:hypothetical protein
LDTTGVTASGFHYVDCGAAVPIGDDGKGYPVVSKITARRRFVPTDERLTDPRTGELDLVIGGFGLAVEAEVAVLSAPASGQSAAEILAFWDGYPTQERSFAWAEGPHTSVLASGHTIVEPLGPRDRISRRPGG